MQGSFTEPILVVKVPQWTELSIHMLPGVSPRRSANVERGWWLVNIWCVCGHVDTW